MTTIGMVPESDRTSLTGNHYMGTSRYTCISQKVLSSTDAKAPCNAT